ncbi:hypothetical protein D1AOALGA4SA_5738 [Olavius algarvensis Delta 1 endosymbiont]|nr:hypothetical protein D1AOALGA4SA_5738 [Olavius algarvensis Delta 1 endosymbiont]
MKLQHLLQKCSFCSPIRLAVFGPEAAARVKLHKKEGFGCQVSGFSKSLMRGRPAAVDGFPLPLLS